MKSLYLPRPSHTRSPAILPAGQPVHTLAIARGQSVQLTTLAGCVWLTCDGALQDCFLPAGHRMAVAGPACLRLGSAHLHAAAEVAWQIHSPRPLGHLGHLGQRLAAVWRRWRRWRAQGQPAASSAHP